MFEVSIKAYYFWANFFVDFEFASATFLAFAMG